MFRYSQRWLIIGRSKNGNDVVSPEFEDLDILLDSEVTIARQVGESVFELNSSKYKKDAAKSQLYPTTALWFVNLDELTFSFHTKETMDNSTNDITI